MTPYFKTDDFEIYNGDCAEILPLIGQVDAIVTDPPYGIGESQAKVLSRGQLAKPRDYGEHDWDKSAPDKVIFQYLLQQSKHQIIFGGNFFELPPTSCILVWDKLNSGDFADCELAWTNLKKAVRIFKYRWNGCLQQEAGPNKEWRVHPTQKPLEVMSWAISHLPKDTATILDPFMGSGTTLLAARKAGIKAIGIEREQKYCDLAVKRLTGEIGLTWGEQAKIERRQAGQLDLFTN